VEILNKFIEILKILFMLAFILLMPIMIMQTVLNINILNINILSEDEKFIHNSFNVIETNWSSAKPILMDTSEESLPVTRQLINVLANDYPCANEQFVLLTKDDEVIPVKINFATSTQMSVDFPDSIPVGAYAIHSHPLQTCGDFTIREVATFPSPADLIVNRNNGINDIIVVTKVSNETAIATRVHGYIKSPKALNLYAFTSNIVGFDTDTTLSLFKKANISYSVFTITVNSRNGMIVVNRVTDDIL
jgi:hypothetical protein